MYRCGTMLADDKFKNQPNIYNQRNADRLV